MKFPYLNIAIWWQSVAAISIFFSGCGGRMSEEVNLNEPVRYMLAGKKYEVPLGYHYDDFLKRKNRWPNPKDEFTEAGGISITGLIPGVRPYDESVRAEFERLGHGNKISIIISPRISLYPSDEYVQRMRGMNRLDLLPSDLNGLAHYWDNQGASDKSKGADLYIKEGDGEYFRLQCPRVGGPSPSCTVMTVTNSGLQVEYVFSISHLRSWREIDDDVAKSIESFMVK